VLYLKNTKGVVKTSLFRSPRTAIVGIPVKYHRTALLCQE